MKIIVDTKMRRIPQKCTECKYSYSIHGFKRCSLKQSVDYHSSTHRNIPLVFVPSLNNYSYIRPKWCPLKEVNL